MLSYPLCEQIYTLTANQSKANILGRVQLFFAAYIRIAIVVIGKS